jgi:hypothetical protein
MKLFSNAFFSCVIFLCFSCSKGDKAREDNPSLVDEVLALKNYDDQRLSFSELLSPEQKSTVGHMRINQMMKENNLTQSQKDMLLVLKSNIKPEIYVNISSRNEFMQRFGNEWLNKALGIFNRDMLLKYLANLSNNDVAASLSDCNCNSGSAFSCIGRNECTNFNCNDTNWGCGFMFVYTCDGRCTLN